MQDHTKTGMSDNLGKIEMFPKISEEKIANSDRNISNIQLKDISMQDMNILEQDVQQMTREDYHLKYHYDHVFVIGDDRLKQNVEIMIGKRTLYCAFHDTRSSEHDCEHVRFIQMLDKLQI
ncbi:MAG: hypothetical protein R2685_11390 [Candidatus Nitrosocosmicus sp.]|nr:hypothetical protein [Candidatus Nitrosocosmicus sp.]